LEGAGCFPRKEKVSRRGEVGEIKGEASKKNKATKQSQLEKGQPEGKWELPIS